MYCIHLQAGYALILSAILVCILTHGNGLYVRLISIDNILLYACVIVSNKVVVPAGTQDSFLGAPVHPEVNT